MIRYLKSPASVLVVLLVALLLPLDWAAAQDATPPQISWHSTPSTGAVYGAALSERGTELVALIGYGFEPGGAIVSLDPATGVERWRLDIPEAPSSKPVIENGVVYAGIGSLVTGPSAVYALDLTSGKQLWRSDISNPELPATPVDGVTLDGTTLYVNRGDAVVLALDATTGQSRWQIQLDKPQRGTPVVAGDLVYISTGFDGAKIYALDAATGEERWSVERPDNPVTGPIIGGDLLIVPFTNGELVAFDAMSGDERWRADAGLRSSDDPTVPYPGLPLVAGDTVFATSNGFSGSSLEAFSLQTGDLLWTVPVGEFSATAPAMRENVVIVGSDSGELIGFDRTNGSEHWRVPVPDKVHLALDQDEPPMIGGNLIVVIDNAGGIAGLNI